MLLTRLRPALLLCSTSILTATLALSGCHENQHPDYRTAVYNALDQNNLRSITVSQDRGEGTITLTGIVGSMDRRQQAESIAKQAAPGYQIADQIQIKEAGLHDDIQAATQKAQLDSAIEDNFKARLSDEPSLKSEKIQFTAYHGTLSLKGTVRNDERTAAGRGSRQKSSAGAARRQSAAGPSRETIACRLLMARSYALPTPAMPC